MDSGAKTDKDTLAKERSIRIFADTLNSLSDKDIEALGNRLRLYIVCEHPHRLKGLKERKDIDEIISESIYRAMTGKRHYRPGLDLYYFLCGIISSILSHAAQSYAEVKRYVDHSAEEAFCEGNLEGLAIRNDDNEDALIKELDRQSAVDEFERFVRCTEDFPVLWYFQIWRDWGQLSPTEVDDLMGVGVLEIYNIKKRYIRLLKGFHATRALDRD